MSHTECQIRDPSVPCTEVDSEGFKGHEGGQGGSGSVRGTDFTACELITRQEWAVPCSKQPQGGREWQETTIAIPYISQEVAFRFISQVNKLRELCSATLWSKSEKML